MTMFYHVPKHPSKGLVWLLVNLGCINKFVVDHGESRKERKSNSLHENTQLASATSSFSSGL